MSRMEEKNLDKYLGFPPVHEEPPGWKGSCAIAYLGGIASIATWENRKDCWAFLQSCVQLASAYVPAIPPEAVYFITP